MQTATPPASIRDQAYAIIRGHTRNGSQWKDPLLGAGVLVVCDVLIDLERHFRIDLEADELWTTSTVHDLVDVVERACAAKLRRLLIPANEDGADLPMIDRARARRALIDHLAGPTQPVPPPSGEGDREAVEGAPVPEAGVYTPPPEAIDRHVAARNLARILWRCAWVSFAAGSAGAVAAFAMGLA